MSKRETIAFKQREFRGSRFRCLLATHQPRERVLEFFRSLTEGHAQIPSDALYAPRGFLEPAEAMLDEAPGFLREPDRKALGAWWLKVHAKMRPSWDLVCQATVQDRSGLVLVEAKAHEGEFKTVRDCSGSAGANAASIANAMREANAAWNDLAAGFALSETSHFQLCNRFAFAWKVASMGYPVVLVYLGFLNAEEMTEGKLLRDHAQWRQCVVAGSEGVVPAGAWDSTIEVSGTLLSVLIRSADVNIEALVRAGACA